jgi:hypothetical protein
VCGLRESSASVCGCGESLYLSKESKAIILGTSINVETKNVSAELHRMSDEGGTPRGATIRAPVVAQLIHTNHRGNWNLE